jgi:hypothetical protein
LHHFTFRARIARSETRKFKRSAIQGGAATPPGIAKR